MLHAQRRCEEEAEISHGGFMTGQHVSKSGRAMAWALLVVFVEISCALSWSRGKINWWIKQKQNLEADRKNTKWPCSIASAKPVKWLMSGGTDETYHGVLQKAAIRVYSMIHWENLTTLNYEIGNRLFLSLSKCDSLWRGGGSSICKVSLLSHTKLEDGQIFCLWFLCGPSR